MTLLKNWNRLNYASEMSCIIMRSVVLFFILAQVTMASVVAFTSVYTFGLAVVEGDWAEYLVTKVVNVESNCFLYFDNKTYMVAKPLIVGDRIKVVVRQLTTTIISHPHNSTTIYVKNGSALCDIYFNGQLLWAANDSSSPYLGYLPLGLDFHYVVGEGYWDSLRSEEEYTVTENEFNATVHRWDWYSVVNKNKGIVLEAGYKFISEGDTSEYQIILVDTNTNLVIPEFPITFSAAIFITVLSILLILLKKKLNFNAN